MNVRRMMGVAALGAAATSLVFVPGAGAQQIPTDAASASGETLVLSLFGQGLTAGRAEASLEGGNATADGAAFVTPLGQFGASSADAGAGQPGSAEPSCEAGFDQVPGFSFGLACSSAQASAGSATSTATIGTGTINPLEPLLDTPLSTVFDGAQGGLDTLLDALQPVTGPLAGAGLDLDSTLRQLFDGLFEGADLLTITGGDTVVETTATDTAVTASCAAEGVRIDVLDAPGEIGPVLSVLIGQAGTDIVVPRDGSDPTRVANPTPVTLTSPLLPGGQISVPPLQTIELPLPEPLGTWKISLAGGEAGVDEQGTHFAQSDSVDIELLTGEMFMGGVKLQVVGCSASVAGITPPAAPPAPQQDLPQQGASLPKTGTNGPDGVALAAVAGLGIAGLALLRRSRTQA